MYKIIVSDINSNYSRVLYELLVNEWPNLSPFQSVVLGLEVPKPIVALANNHVVGGLSFTRYDAPDSNKITTWINALYVSPKYRKRGIAKQLIYAARKSSQTLYALTEHPDLYTNAGWQYVKRDLDGTVVKQ